MLLYAGAKRKPPMINLSFLCNNKVCCKKMDIALRFKYASQI